MQTRALLKASCEAGRCPAQSACCHMTCCIVVAPLKLRVKLRVKQVSSPVSVLPSGKASWGRQKAPSGRRNTKECTSIVEGLKVIYYSKVKP